MRYPIPARSAAALARLGNRARNPGLIFDRFGPDWLDSNTAKKDGLLAVKAAAARADGALLRGWNVRWEALARSAGADGDALFRLRTDWRLIAGLGRKGSLEVGFTFHRYGFPVLPGSSVKGLARAYAVLADGKTHADPDVCRVFGRAAEHAGEESAAGLAVFFDAIPSGLPVLELDIMNPHYPGYYAGLQAPHDGMKPIPIYFLTVAADTEFRFAVGWRAPRPLDAEALRLQDLAVRWLRGGLMQLGAGGKTSAGYGYFVEPESSGNENVSPVLSSPTPQDVPTLIWRQGDVREYQPGAGRGRLVDTESNIEYRFRKKALEDGAWSPGKGHRIEYALDPEGQAVVAVRRRR